MSKKRKVKNDDHKAPNKLPSVETESEEESRKIFLEAMSKLSGSKPPDKDSHAQSAGGQARGNRSIHAKNQPREIDLHGLTLDEAKERVRVRLLTILRELSGQTTFIIITGKGRHSGPGGSVLASQIHSFVRTHFAAHIVHIEESPSDVTIGGVPIRGHFRVTLRRHQNGKYL